MRRSLWQLLSNVSLQAPVRAGVADEAPGDCALQEKSLDVHQGRWIAWYVTVLLGGFVPLYLLTRSSILIGDGGHWVNMAREGDPAQLHYGSLTHFLQIPLVRTVWRALEAIGLPASLESIFLGFSLVGTLAAIIFVGLIAAEFLRSRVAAWLAAVLFGTSLHVWTQWIGDLYGLALGFVTAGLFFAVRGRVLAPAFLWALSALSHLDFVLAAPAFMTAVWMVQPGAITTREKLRSVVWLLGLAAVSVVLVLLLGSWALGMWFDASSLVAYLWRPIEATLHYKNDSPFEVLRAIKGLVTAHTVAGHYWRDILTGRGVTTAIFLLASAVGFFVLVLTGVLLAAAASWRRLVMFALAWLLPFHILINWAIAPTVEKYHAGALPGFTLLITAGLVHLASLLSHRGRYALCVGYVALCAGLNFFGGVVPMQALGPRVVEAEREIRQLTDERAGRAVFVACDDPKAINRAGVTFLRLRSIWRGTIPEIQEAILSWTQARLREGEQPYLVDRWCFPEEWGTEWSKERFDLFFLGQSFRLVPTRITGIPVTEVVSTNPFSWRRGDIVRLEPLAGSQ